ncbi:MAG: ABC transporter ATP-binding protein/permease [Bacillota bacterium]|nr:ABC transporter ATP-binding protein/permease [Bacillota bacterium]
MLKLQNLDKTFNKRKKNKIHAVNNTSLEMGDTGLVALLGPSGCGKTTLLNVIGGLDAPDKGDVVIDGQRLTRRRSGKTDSIRTLKIGYIFQNYNLVENLTVFENVAIALRMSGVRNEAVIEEKVKYVLEKTGMYRYRNRTAEMLSGGERQRVGIARAIVKNPSIIIADEPTGNLDSRNTLEIMNIIKTISREKLVILVTHEEELAEFYTTRIVKIRDGKVISDNENEGTDGLDYSLDYKVYLKDIKDHKRLRNDKYELNFYNDSQDRLNLDIVIRKGNILIRNNNPETRLEVVDEDSPIELINDHYRKIEEGDDIGSGFDPGRLETGTKKRYRAVVGPVKMIKTGFSRVMDYSVIKKILLVGFFISAMFMTYAVSSIFGTINLTDDMFVTKDKSYLNIVSKHNDVNDYEELEKNRDIAYVMPGDSIINLNLKYDAYLQTVEAYVCLSGSLSDKDKISQGSLLYGRLPEKNREIVVDRLAVKNSIKEYSTKECGLGKVRDYLGCKVEIPNMGTFKIVGITDMESPCIYAPRSQFVNIIANSSEESDDTGLVDYGLMKSKVKKVKGSWPTKPYQVMVNEINKDEMKIGKTIDTKVNGQKLKVSGYFKDGNDSDILLVNNATVKYKLIKTTEGITVCPNDKDEVLSQLRDDGINIVDSYNQSRKEYISQNKAYNNASLMVAFVILAISCIEIFIIMRASFLSRVKEVGVYRAIGVKKGDIYRMFMGEILAITTITSLPGFAFMFYVIGRLGKVSYFSSLFITTPAVASICLGLIYAINLIFGLIPVMRTMRKRPAAILSRTDVN